MNPPVLPCPRRSFRSRCKIASDKMMINTGSRPSIITLTTDFGLQDEYVAVLKGVILCYAPTARIIDISHLVPPQSIRSAAHLLARSYKFFPPGTIHLVVVDPEVGSNRSILALAAEGQYFVGPDNGVFTPIFDQATSLLVHQVEVPSESSLNNVSATFHGRDIMAPAAGKLAIGVEIAKLGPITAAKNCRHMQGLHCLHLGDTLHGEIVHVDNFGNLCSNVSRQDLKSFADGSESIICVAGKLIVPFDQFYASRPKGTVLALFDSHNFLEIAVNQGNAAKQLGLGVGSGIVISRR